MRDRVAWQYSFMLVEGRKPNLHDPKICPWCISASQRCPHLPSILASRLALGPWQRREFAAALVFVCVCVIVFCLGQQRTLLGEGRGWQGIRHATLRTRVCALPCLAPAAARRAASTFCWYGRCTGRDSLSPWVALSRHGLPRPGSRGWVEKEAEAISNPRQKVLWMAAKGEK